MSNSEEENVIYNPEIISTKTKCYDSTVNSNIAKVYGGEHITINTTNTLIESPGYYQWKKNPGSSERLLELHTANNGNWNIIQASMCKEFNHPFKTHTLQTKFANLTKTSVKKKSKKCKIKKGMIITT